MKRTKSPFILLLCLVSISFMSCAGNKAREPESEKAGSMIDVPGGSFKMGASLNRLTEGPEHDVSVAAFQIDKYEVSAKEFADFLNAKGNPGDKYFSFDEYSTIIETSDNPGQDPVYMARKGLENFPANNVSWYGADAYCRWMGKRLPTEAEWEKAARGTDRRLYPWGKEYPDNRKADYQQKWEEKGFNVMVPVDALPEGVSFYGAFNMAGNVWEWVNDWFRQNYCDYCNPDIESNIDILMKLSGRDFADIDKDRQKKKQVPPMENPAGPSAGSFKVLRGGSWYDSYGELVVRSTYRYWLAPEEMYLNTGFRCVDKGHPVIVAEGIPRTEPAPPPPAPVPAPAPEPEPVPAPEPEPVRIILEDIHFDFDMATLTPAAVEILQENIRTMKANPGIRVQIEGHTCAHGTETYNSALSERRAVSVREYFVKEGISSDRLTTISYGEMRLEMPEAPTPQNKDSLEAKSNRRVHFEIIVR